MEKIIKHSILLLMGVVILFYSGVCADVLVSFGSSVLTPMRPNSESAAMLLLGLCLLGLGAAARKIKNY